MEWKTHRITTFATVFALTGSIPATAIATASSALPDVLEGKVLIVVAFCSAFGLSGSLPGALIAAAVAAVVEIKYLQHRTLTHYPWIFIVPAALLWRQMQTTGGYIAYTVFFILVGYILHLIQDFMSKSGIPLFHPYKQSRGLRLYVTHTPSEFTVAMAWVLFAAAFAWSRDMLTPQYLTQVMENAALFANGLIHHYSKA